MWLAFPGYDQWWLAPVAIAALTLATAGAGALRGALIGFVAGLCFFLPVLQWSGIFVGALPWIALSVAQALFIAALGAVTGSWGPRTAAGTVRDARINPVVVALAWVVSEFGRGSFPYGGFPWGRLAFSQADAPVLGAASLIGTPGVGFLVALGGATLAWGAHRWASSTTVGGSSTRGTGSGPAGGARVDPQRSAVLAVTAAVVGTTLFAPALVPRPIDGEPLQVLGVQGNVPQMGLDFNAQRRAVLENHVNGTLRAAELIEAGELPTPDLVIWPENASDIDPLRNEDAAELIRVATDAVDTPILLGAVLRVDGGLHNAQMQWRPGEGPVDSYIKRRPVPFAEYIPHRNFYRLFTDAVDLVGDEFLPGEEIGVMDVQTRAGTVRAGIGICFEIILDPEMRDTVLNGADLLVIPTNNATFGFTDEAVQQLAASRVKAVELGRSVAHISNVGVSALILPDGSVVQRTELFTADLLSAELPRRDAVTVAARLGPWPERAAVAALVLSIGINLVRRRTSTQSARAAQSADRTAEAPGSTR